MHVVFGVRFVTETWGTEVGGGGGGGESTHTSSHHTTPHHTTPTPTPTHTQGRGERYEGERSNRTVNGQWPLNSEEKKEGGGGIDYFFIIFFKGCMPIIIYAYTHDSKIDSKGVLLTQPTQPTHDVHSEALVISRYSQKSACRLKL